MDATELRPLSLGELLDRTFRLYRNNFWLFTGIMAVPSALSIPFSVLFFSTQTSALAGVPPSPKVLGGMIFYGLTFFVLFFAVYAVAIGATTLAVSEIYLGQTISIRGAFGKVRGNVWRIIGVVVVALLRAYGMLILAVFGMAIAIGISSLAIAAAGSGPSRIVAGIVVGVVVVLAYLAGIVLWLWWSLRYAVSIPALLLERVGVLAALRRSVYLTRGRRWQMLVTILLCSIIAYVGIIVFQGPFFMTMLFSMRSGHVPEWLAYASAMSGAIGGAITGPVLLIALVLCYYDTRIRKEAFDLQFMMSTLDQPAPVGNTGLPA